MTELFTKKLTANVHRETMDCDEYEVEVTVTNDAFDICDGEFVETSYWSAKHCKRMSMTTDEEPSVDEIEAWMEKNERAEFVSID